MQRLTQPRSEGCLSDFAIDELFAGELEAATEAEARTHLATCESCRARLAGRAADQAAFAAKAPPLSNVRSIRSARRWPLASVTAVVAAAAALFLYLRVSKPGPMEETRMKGGDRLGLYVQRSGAVSQAAPGESIQPGDSLQFTYTTSRPGYLAVISVDGAKRASVYFPVAPQAAPIAPGRDVELSNSTVLDATLGAETAYGLFCDTSIELEPVRAAFEASPDAPPIPKGCAVDRIAFTKESKP